MLAQIKIWLGVALFFLYLHLCRPKKINPRLVRHDRYWALHGFCAWNGVCSFSMENHSMKRISSLITSFLVSFSSLSSAGAVAAIDGALSVASSDPGILAVTPLDGGLFRVDVVGIGLAKLTVSADADLGDNVYTIRQDFEFEVYDGHDEADHFVLSITDIVRSNGDGTALADEPYAVEATATA